MVPHTSELEDVLLLSVYFRFHIFPYLRFFFLCICVVLHISKVLVLLVWEWNSKLNLLKENV